MMRFRHLSGLTVIFPYFNAISVDLYAIKCLIYIYFCVISVFLIGRRLRNVVGMKCSWPGTCNKDVLAISAQGRIQGEAK